MKIQEMGYVAEMRQRMGIDPDDTSRDERLEKMDALERVRLIAGWKLGDTGWVDSFKGWCESQGIYLTTNEEADGVIGW